MLQNQGIYLQVASPPLQSSSSCSALASPSFFSGKDGLNVVKSAETDGGSPGDVPRKTMTITAVSSLLLVTRLEAVSQLRLTRLTPLTHTSISPTSCLLFHRWRRSATIRTPPLSYSKVHTSTITPLIRGAIRLGAPNRIIQPIRNSSSCIIGIA